MDYMDRLPNCPHCGKEQWAGEVHKCENKIVIQPEYDALYKFDAENNFEPTVKIAEKIAAKHGFDDKHSIVDDIHYALEDMLEFGQKRGKLIPK